MIHHHVICTGPSVFARADTLFTRETDNMVTHASATFVTHSQDVDAVDNFDIATVLRHLNKAVENWNSRGSGYNMKRVTRFTLCMGALLYSPVDFTDASDLNTLMQV